MCFFPILALLPLSSYFSVNTYHKNIFEIGIFRKSYKKKLPGMVQNKSNSGMRATVKRWKRQWGRQVRQGLTQEKWSLPLGPQESLENTQQSFFSYTLWDLKLLYLNLEEKGSLRNWMTWDRWILTVMFVSFPSDSSYVPNGLQAHGWHM